MQRQISAFKWNPRFQYLISIGEDRKLEDGLNLLSSYSLVAAMLDGDAYKMHRMVQLSLVTWMKKNGLFEALASLAVCLVDDIFTSSVLARRFPICETILPHARKVLTYKVDGLGKIPALMTAVSTYLADNYRLCEADRISQEAIALLDSNSAIGEKHIAPLLSCRSNILALQGNLTKAQSLGEAALEKAKADPNPDTRQIVSILNQLCIISMKMDSFARAEEYSKQALHLCLDTMEPGKDWSILAMSNHITVLHSQGKLQDLECIRRQLLSLSTDVNGAIHMTTFEMKWMLGQDLSRQMKFREAEILVKEALAGMRTILSSDHDLILRLLRSLYGTLSELQQWQEAEPLSREAFEIVRRTRILDDKDSWHTMHEFLAILVGIKKNDEAESIARDVLAITRQTPSKIHLIDEGLTVLGQVLRFQDKPEELERVFIEQLGITTKDDQIRRMMHLGEHLFRQARYKEVENLLRLALRIDHPDWPGYEERKADMSLMLTKVEQNISR